MILFVSIVTWPGGYYYEQPYLSYINLIPFFYSYDLKSLNTHICELFQWGVRLICGQNKLFFLPITEKKDKQQKKISTTKHIKLTTGNQWSNQSDVTGTGRDQNKNVMQLLLFHTNLAIYGTVILESLQDFKNSHNNKQISVYDY